MDLWIGRSPNLRGWVKVPPNKSQSFRALIFAALAEGKSKILSPAVSNDWMHATEALEMFGATIEPKAGGIWEVTGNGGNLRTPDDVVQAGNSGIMLRFGAALAACCGGYTVLSGDESLRHIRLCQPLLDAINALGGWAVSTKGDGHAPLVVRGPLKGGRAEIDGLDSQPVSALLIACSLAEAPTELLIRRAGEKPWVKMTLAWLDRLGVEYKASPSLALQFGLVDDKSPVPTESVSPLLPDAERKGASIGASIGLSPKTRLDVSYFYLKFKDRSTEGINSDGYDGTYKTTANLLGITVVHKV